MPYPPFAGGGSIYHGAVMSILGDAIAAVTEPFQSDKKKKKKDKVPKVGTSDYVSYANKKDNNASAIAAYDAKYVRKYTDPLYWIFGDRYLKLVDQTIPTAVNRFLEPFTEVARATDPLHYIAGQDSGYNEAGDWTENKSGDVLAALAALYFGGSALAGSGGSGGSAGSGANPGPWASGYQFPAGSEFGASNTGFGSLNGLGGGYSQYGPYASGYEFPGSTDLTTESPFQYRRSFQMPQQEQQQQKRSVGQAVADYTMSFDDYYAQLKADEEARLAREAAARALRDAYA